MIKMVHQSIQNLLTYTLKVEMTYPNPYFMKNSEFKNNTTKDSVTCKVSTFSQGYLSISKKPGQKKIHFLSPIWLTHVIKKNLNTRLRTFYNKSTNLKAFDNFVQTHSSDRERQSLTNNTMFFDHPEHPTSVFKKTIILQDGLNLFLLTEDLNMLRASYTSLLDWCIFLGYELPAFRTRLSHGCLSFQYSSSSLQVDSYNIDPIWSNTNNGLKHFPNFYPKHAVPSKISRKRYFQYLKTVFQNHRATPPTKLLSQLNSIIYARNLYLKHKNARKAFMVEYTSPLDNNLLLIKLRRWWFKIHSYSL
uniref:Putative intron maturase n=1 Tax=Entransia fimbriata TaxID=130991 RepID=A0A191T4Y2_9VIRI|nr:putative intron maturase [Entransia fimbriata]YP_009256735.1 putative intron maturase [Entransia fimbriata]ANI25455.1 putative intron maturase [Entransia fimbriata]ANI25456.1 putative intron maturase [Entransia fimbriata]WKT05746.1 putative intron maturase [Entransia fimbriata]WKT05747.1 putative intron maturase [Entransia fimbriata]WKT05865.1 putative intron maturase [Entransia fimbriata]